jgi:hypothetical protein
MMQSFNLLLAILRDCCPLLLAVIHLLSFCQHSGRTWQSVIAASIIGNPLSSETANTLLEEPCKGEYLFAVVSLAQVIRSIRSSDP